MLVDRSLLRLPVKAASAGYVSGVDAFALGRAICDIGGGRIKAEDSVDHAVGYASAVKIGDEVRAGDPFGIVYCRTETQFESISEKLRNAYKISEVPPETTKLIRATV